MSDTQLSWSANEQPSYLKHVRKIISGEKGPTDTGLTAGLDSDGTTGVQAVIDTNKHSSAALAPNRRTGNNEVTRASRNTTYKTCIS